MNKKNQASKRQAKKLKRAKKLKSRQEMYGTQSAAEAKAIQTFRSKKRSKRNLQKEAEARDFKARQSREMIARTRLPMVGEIREVKPGFFSRLKDKLFTK